ncbi:MAG: DUF3006 domain-containing protein [Methanocorpusculum sp.]|jgi:hypothetical protein|nr:DUF3006 domain-containing protein [Methanocorpusculum sp.]MDD3257368.1 DUF3006 family protein [Methanocorpusculum sp.]MDD4132335.1 DUF3006 family protein [Methanocorpusculum sp.]
MKLLVTVDMIEKNKASLLLRNPDGEIPLGVFPLVTLPEGTSVGDILSLTFTKEEEETKSARDRVRVLHETLRKR